MPLDGTRLVIIIYLRLELSKEEKLALSVSLIYFFLMYRKTLERKRTSRRGEKLSKELC
jgi:hypothetical protein